MNTKTHTGISLIMSSLLLLILIVLACGKNELLTGDRDSDLEKLIALRAEIDSLVLLHPCEDADEWQITAIGAKACGGPTDYIAYSNRLDTDDFLRKVEYFTRVNEAYNNKWNVASDCMYLTPPSHVVCEDGRPKLIWAN